MQATVQASSRESGRQRVRAADITQLCDNTACGWQSVRVAVRAGGTACGRMCGRQGVRVTRQKQKSSRGSARLLLLLLALCDQRRLPSARPLHPPHPHQQHHRRCSERSPSRCMHMSAAPTAGVDGAAPLLARAGSPSNTRTCHRQVGRSVREPATDEDGQHGTTNGEQASASSHART